MRFINRDFFRSIERVYGCDAKATLKKWSRTRINIIKIRSKITFLRFCRDNDFMPPHLLKHRKFEIPLFSQQLLLSYRRLLFRTSNAILKLEIADAYKYLRFLRATESSLVRGLFECLPDHIINKFFKKQHFFFLRFERELRFRRERKLRWISRSVGPSDSSLPSINYFCVLPPRLTPPSHPYALRSSSLKTHFPPLPSPSPAFSFSPIPHPSSHSSFHINIDIDRFLSNSLPTDILHIHNNKWFVNNSSVVFPGEVCLLLQLGDKFSLPSSIFKRSALTDFIKFFEHNLSGLPSVSVSVFRSYACRLISASLSSRMTLSHVERNLLSWSCYAEKFMSEHPEVIVTRADKGNVTVALDRADYLHKMNVMLSDCSTYAVVNKDPTRKITTCLIDLVNRWKRRDYISASRARFLHVSDGVLPRAYGLPKIHKRDCPLRIIVSSINSPLHPLASYLHSLLFDNLPAPSSRIINSYDVVEKLRDLKLDDHHKLFSLDVVSLFTNVPLELVIKGIGKRWHILERNIRLPYFEFLTALRLVIDSTYFSFNNVIYKQIFGTPMGSPLSPILADIVLQDLEEIALSQISCYIPFYIRYVDDVAMAAPRIFIPNILKTFNSFHKRLLFTVEIPDNDSLNFLDITIFKLDDNHLEFDWYTKPTFSGRFLNFYSQHPLIHKKGVVIGLTDKIFRLSHPKFHTSNFERLIFILLDNGYPLNFIIKNIFRRLKFLISNSNSARNIPSLPPPSLPSPSHRTYSPSFFILPYIKNFSEKFFHLAKKYGKTLGFRVTNKLNKFIRLYKDRLPSGHRTNVVYKINCTNCEASYVGQTRRKLSTRVKEHEKDINKNKENLNVISLHRLTGHDFDWASVTVLDEEPVYRRRLISEMIHIASQELSLNIQSDTDNLDKSYIALLEKFFKISRSQSSVQ